MIRYNKLIIEFVLLYLLRFGSTQECENGGSRIQGICYCPIRFTGARCETEICSNNGVPVSDPGDPVKCDCPYGWIGDLCEEPEVCYNGDKVDGKCKCWPKFKGVNCLQRICRKGIEFEVHHFYFPCFVSSFNVRLFDHLRKSEKEVW